MKKWIGVIVIGLILFVSAGALKAEVFSNGGFEETEAAPPSLMKVLDTAGWKYDTPLVFPKQWRTNSGVKTANGEYRLITDSKQAHSGNNCIFIRGHFNSIGNQLKVSGGDTVEVSFYVKDKDKKDAFAFLYLYGTNEEGKKIYCRSISHKTQTDETWTKQTGTITIPTGKIKDVYVSSATLAVASPTGAYFDDVELTIKKAE
jgi:hypothetical protein